MYVAVGRLRLLVWITTLPTSEVRKPLAAHASEPYEVRQLEDRTSAFETGRQHAVELAYFAGSHQ